MWKVRPCTGDTALVIESENFSYNVLVKVLQTLHKQQKQLLLRYEEGIQAVR